MSKKEKIRLQSKLNNYQSPRVDRQNSVIYGVSAMTTGSALGHGMAADRKTLEIVARLANSKLRGITGRFGHIGQSENGMGKKIQVAKNFRVAESENGQFQLLHDSYFLESARTSPAFSNDPIEYIFNMVEENSNEIGESAVLATETVWVFEDGSEEVALGERPDDAINEEPIMRPTSLYFIDIVGDPALNPNGMFSRQFAAEMFEGTSSEYAAQGYEILDGFIDSLVSEFNVNKRDVPMKLKKFLGGYLNSRNYEQEESPMNEEIEQVEEVQEVEAEEAETESIEDSGANEGGDSVVGEAALQAQINDMSTALGLVIDRLDEFGQMINGNFEAVNETVTSLQSQLDQVKSFQSAVKSSTPKAVLKRLQSAASTGEKSAPKSVADGDAVTGETVAEFGQDDGLTKEQKELAAFLGGSQTGQLTV